MNGRVSQRHERVECHQAANRQPAIQDLVCPRPEEEADGKKGHRIDGTLVGHRR